MVSRNPFLGMVQFVLGLLNEERRVLVPSAAALNARIVSSGRSMRFRVGFERSGSAVTQVSTLWYKEHVCREELTDNIAIAVPVCHPSQVVYSRLFLCLFSYD